MGGYQPIVIDSFGGLVGNYRANTPIGATPESQDFVIGQNRRSVRARLGFDNHTSSAAAAAYTQLYPHSDTRLLARRTTTLAAINTSGAEATTTTVSSSNFVHATRYGTPSASYSYIADGSTALIRYDGTSFTAGTSSATVDGSGSAAMPKGKFLTVTGSSNRLVVAGTASSGGPGGATSGGSYVWFSDPGSAETWDSNNFVQLDPGDGESIVGCCTWRDQVYVFKKSKLYIFYGETTDADGNPVFNYRSVHLGGRIDVLAPTASFGNASVTTAPDGVYFSGSSGVWVTTGDVPANLTDDAFRDLTYDPSPIRGVSHAYLVGLGLHHHMGRLYLNLGVSGQRVYDMQLGEWMTWSAPVTGLATWKNGGSEPLLMASATNSNDVVKFSDTNNEYTDDNGTAIATRRYQTSWWDLGLPGEKSIREVEIWGGGSVDVKVYADFVASGGTSTTLDLGSATSTSLSTRKIASVAVTGNYFAVDISASAYFRIDRIILHLRDDKNIGAKSS